MKQNYSIEGMTCTGCVATVKKSLEAHPEVNRAEVSLEKKEAILDTQVELTIDDLQSQLDKKYQLKRIDRLDDRDKMNNSAQTQYSYKPLIIIVIYLAGISTLASFKEGYIHFHLWMQYFMAGFFLTFSFFKFLDLKGFAESYAMYDVLAKKVPSYGFIYPFLELALGVSYLTNFEPQFTYTATIALMGFSSIGVIQSVLDNRKIKCACLGTVFNLPMTTVTIVEDLLMVTMAIFMLMGT
jgi:copper chaperone CopZ